MASRRTKKKEPETLGSLQGGNKDATGQQQLPSQLGMRLKKKGRWWQCGPVKFFVLVFAALFILNFASLKREYKALLPSGQLIDIGWGQKLFIRCTGSGEPVVILDAPTGETSDIWTLVEPALSKFTKVCVYDRAGLGFSDRGYKNTSAYAGDFSDEAKARDKLMPSTVERMVDDLHHLLHQMIGTSPILIVGVDYSAFIARFYAQVYEEQVAGLFLLDPMVETVFDDNSSWAHHWYEEALPHLNMLYLAAGIGLNRVALLSGIMKPVQDLKIMKVVKEDFINRKKYMLCSTTHLSSLIDEVFLTNESMQQVKTMFKVKPFPRHVPITIATYDQNSNDVAMDLKKLWKESQDFLEETIHPGSKHLVLPGSDHNMLYLNPKPVISAIATVISELRTSARK